jgi:tRNA(His) guanylyltransferase
MLILTAIGDRMKGYERAFLFQMPSRIPVIVRVDGKAFHTLLAGAEKPFDMVFKSAMDEAAKALVSEIQGALLAYIQSDEISLFINNYSSLEYQPYFDNEVQKIASISSSVATSAFNRIWIKGTGNFDGRVFVVPKEEVCNYFIWRQQDWTRNSIQMVTRSLYSHKECEDKNGDQMQEMIFNKGVNWNDLPVWQKRGRCVYKVTKSINEIIRTELVVDDNIPIFTQDRDFIEKFVNYATEDKSGGDKE